MQIDVKPQEFVDYIMFIALLNLSEENNDNFILNKNKKWKKMVNLLKNYHKGDLLKTYMDSSGDKKSKFNIAKKIFYNGDSSEPLYFKITQ